METAQAIIIGVIFFGVLLSYLAILGPEISEVKWINQSLNSTAGIGKALTIWRWFRGQRTPQGCKVRGVVDLPAAFLAFVDTGIQNQIDRYNVHYPTWENYKKISDYNILVVDPMATNVETDPGSPALLVHGYQSAGTCIGVNPYDNGKPHPAWQFWKRAVRVPWIVVPHQADSNWSHGDYFMNTIHNESEHVREATNDREVFMSYAITGDVHPHVP